MNYTYYIQYGFAEGKHHGTYLRSALGQHGFTEVADANQADILIAHSGGSYLLPHEHTAWLIVLIGIPMNAEPVWKTFKLAQHNDFTAYRGSKQLKRRLVIQGKNAAYLLRHPRKTRQLVRTVNKNRDALPAVQAPSVVIIANHYDPWVTPLQDTRVLSQLPGAYISLPGSHDHLWQAPAEYASIINYYARRLPL